MKGKTYHAFTYHGQVRGQMRPRFSKFGTYKAKADKEYEDKIRKAYINSGGVHFGDKPVYIKVTVHRQLPKSTPRYVEFEPDTHKPDASNIIKSVEDALNGIAYDDDRQIVEAYCVKCCRTRSPENMEIEVGLA